MSKPGFKGITIVVSGPQGAGKTYLMDKVEKVIRGESKAKVVREQEGRPAEAKALRAQHGAEAVIILETNADEV